jgi:integrase
LKLALLEWRTLSHRMQPTDFVFPSRLYGGRKALDLAEGLKRKIRAFEKAGIIGVGWHTFRHTVGTVLAELGEHQLTIRSLASLESQRDQQVLAGGIESEAEGPGEAGRGDSAGAFAT